MISPAPEAHFGYILADAIGKRTKEPEADNLFLQKSRNHTILQPYIHPSCNKVFSAHDISWHIKSEPHLLLLHNKKVKKHEQPENVPKSISPFHCLKYYLNAYMVMTKNRIYKVRLRFARVSSHTTGISEEKGNPVCQSINSSGSFCLI